MSPIARTSTPTTSRIEPAKVVAQIIAHGMDLKPGQVMLDYERWVIPPEGLFVVVGYLGPSQQVAAQSVLDQAGNEEQNLLNQHHVQVDLMSIIPDNSARLRRWEVPMSLNSIYARNYAASFGVGIQPLQSDMTDTTKLEAGGQLNRFTLRAVVFSSETRTLTPAFFDQFKATLTVASPAEAEKPKQIPLEEN